jgi:uncharacterized membrane protein
MSNLRITATVWRLALRCGVAVLVAIGITSAMGRAWSLEHSGLADNLIRQMLPATEVHFVDESNRWFATHPILTLVHIVPGSLFFILGPFQFSSRIRVRYTRFHRWSGRVVALTALPVGLSGLLFAIVFPFGGLLASSAILVTGAAFFLALTRALIAIRRRDVARHREWMIRMFAIGLGISTVRIVGLLFLAVIPAISLELRMGLSFWTGFALTFGAAEFWVRHTRRRNVIVQPLTTPAQQLVAGEPRLNVAPIEM